MNQTDQETMATDVILSFRWSFSDKKHFFMNILRKTSAYICIMYIIELLSKMYLEK